MARLSKFAIPPNLAQGADWRTDVVIMSTPVDGTGSNAFGVSLVAARMQAGLSTRKLARASGIDQRRIVALERGTGGRPTDRELGLLAQACNTTVFSLLPPGYGLEVLRAEDPAAAEPGGAPARGDEALDALLREYLSMVVELRSGHPITPPSLRHDDLVELAAVLGDTPAAIEARLIALLGADAADAPAIRSLILPSTAG
jgi:transcriptional regulator with XRE-family HTH domain